MRSHKELLRAGATWAIRRSSSCEDLSYGRNRWLVNRVFSAASHSRITITNTSTFHFNKSPAAAAESRPFHTEVDYRVGTASETGSQMNHCERMMMEDMSGMHDVMCIGRRARACKKLSEAAKTLTTRDHLRGISGMSTPLNNSSTIYSFFIRNAYGCYPTILCFAANVSVTENSRCILGY
jgi:hypothetical protein